MSTQDRRRREFEEREKLLLGIAYEIFREQGEAALTMDNLVARSEYSKGTVYKHFSCKEDLLAAICLEKISFLYRLFRQVVALPLCSREKQLGFHIAHGLFVRHYFQESARMLASQTQEMQIKVSAERQARHLELENKLLALVGSVIQQGIDDGDLRLPPGVTPDIVQFSNKALSFGMQTLIDGGCCESDRRWADQYERVHLESVSRLLDGFNWRPYTEACDYQAVLETVKTALQGEFERDAAQANAKTQQTDASAEYQSESAGSPGCQLTSLVRRVVGRKSADPPP